MQNGFFKPYNPLGSRELRYKPVLHFSLLVNLQSWFIIGRLGGFVLGLTSRVFNIGTLSIKFSYIFLLLQAFFRTILLKVSLSYKNKQHKKMSHNSKSANQLTGRLRHKSRDFFNKLRKISIVYMQKAFYSGINSRT